jgi:hypothetical protein
MCSPVLGAGEGKWISGVRSFQKASAVAAYIAFHQYLVDRERKPFSSCSRVGCRTLSPTGRKKKYCSPNCGRADSANNTHKRQSRVDNLKRMRQATVLLDKWIASPTLQKSPWRMCVTDRSPDITKNWLTRDSGLAIATASSATNMQTLLNKIGFASDREAVIGRFRPSNVRTL